MLIHGTAGASFVLYVLALLLRSHGSGISRWLWTLAFALMLVHVLLAFHGAHHWSHRAAYEDTARQTAEVFGVSWGSGVYANYVLLLVWAVDVVRWWRGGFSKATQAFLAFMWFNATVVFGHGWIRWVGVLAFAMLLLQTRRRSARQ